ncbi:membrane transporter [Fusarium venenatum]|uniref:membrane transporter n=1 Tax=Fusarium venenatum TaxID=56646 RepID=UPI001D31A89B|nr:membrane transporter [Fusarium venenatum]
MMRTNEDQDTEAQREYVPQTSPAQTRDNEQSPAEQNTRTDDGSLSKKYPLSELEKGLVGWDSQDDQLTPGKHIPKLRHVPLAQSQSRNLTDFRKCNLSSAMYAPGISFMNKDLHNSSQTLGSWSISIFLLGCSISNTVPSIPLSEIYGRRIVLNLANIFFCAFTLGYALAPNLGGLITMRLLAGLGGSTCLTLGASVMSDLFLRQQRSRAMSMYSLGVIFGPVLGPICGGCINTGGIAILKCETNPVVLLEWKIRRLISELGRPDLQNILTYKTCEPLLSRRDVLKRGIIRPLKLLFTSPIVFLLSLYINFVFGLLLLLFTTIAKPFIQVYDWSPEICGLAYIGVGIGFFIGISFVAKTSDTTVISLTRKNNGVYEPEMQLPYGWSSYKRTHWIVPIIVLLPFGVGMMGIFSAVQIYLVDSFPQHAASALAAMAFLRCPFGSVLPLACPSIFVFIAMIPFPALIYKYGGNVRRKWPVNL